MIRRGLLLAALLSLAVGGALLGEQAWLSAKASVASELIHRAFESYLRDGAVHRPWSWADTHPVARLEVPRLGVRRTILSGASGSSMAFGPGHVDGTAPPGSPGNCVLAGHRDSSFAFLEDLRIGDRIRLVTREGSADYEVAGASVRSMWGVGITDRWSEDRLTLVTCYPFGGLTRSDQRYVVLCRPASPA